MTKELSLFDTLLSTGTKSSGETKVSKEGSSLFDDLLKSATTQNQNISVSTVPLNNQQAVSNQQQIVGSVMETTVKDGLEGKLDTIQSSAVPQNISHDTKASKTEPMLQTNQLVQVKGDTIPNSPNISNNIQTKDVVTNSDEVNNIDLSTNSVDEVVTNKTRDLATKKEVVVENSKKEIKNVIDNVDFNQNNPSKEVSATISSRTPSVLDKIQVDKQVSEQPNVDSILKGITNDSQVKPDNSNIKVVEVSKDNLSIEQQTPRNNDSGVTVNKTEQLSQSITPSINTNKIATDMVVNETSADKDTTMDLFTRLTTQNIDKTVDQVQVVVNTAVSPIKNVETASQNDNVDEIIDNKSVLNDVVSNIIEPKQVVSNDTKDNVATLEVVVSNNLEQQNKESKLQNSTPIASKENVLNVDNKQILQKDSVSVVGNPQQDLESTVAVVPKEKVVKGQENSVETIVKDSVPKEIIVNTDDQTVPVQNNKIEKQSVESLKSDVQTVINKDEPNKKTDTVNTKVLQSDSSNAQDIKINTISDIPKGDTNKQNAAVEFARLNQNETLKTVDVVVDDLQKEALNKTEQVNTKQKSSLLDKLIEDTLKVTTKDSTQTPDKVEIKNGQILENIKTQDSVQKNDIMENIYKSSVSKNISLAAMQNATIAKETLKNGTTVLDIQKSADMLDLNLEGIEEIKIQDTLQSDTKQRAVNIGRAFLEKDLLSKDVLLDKNIQSADMEHKQTSITDTKTTTNNMIQKVVELTIGEAEVLTIQNRIIGARQQLSSMMSDVARAMYENYKPPHTAFRISLNPANLGSIAILIRSQRADNSLSISMNMSSSSTLESVVANQNELRSALQKTFNDNSSFEFDFKLDPDASGGGFPNEGFGSNEQNQETKEDETSTFLASNDIVEEIQEVQKSGTYF